MILHQKFARSFLVVRQELERLAADTPHRLWCRHEYPGQSRGSCEACGVEHLQHEIETLTGQLLQSVKSRSADDTDHAWITRLRARLRRLVKQRRATLTDDGADLLIEAPSLHRWDVGLHELRYPYDKRDPKSTAQALREALDDMEAWSPEFCDDQACDWCRPQQKTETPPPGPVELPPASEVRP